MSQKETTNTFAKGLISDLNAIATPADSLTDAKNATFLTFNGNEMSLQNDMGNTKLIYKYTDLEGGETSEPVALSEGFIPVGVKENGGIIYILSMKPDNEGKCAQVEVGSFPGPEFRPNSKSDPDAQLISTCTLPETYVVNTLEGGENTILKLGTPIQLTEVALEPCDLFEYTLFGVNFDTISTSEERKMYSYKLINMTNNSDITKFCPTFFLNKNISYITFPSHGDNWALSCKIPLADENGTTHNYELMVNA